MSEDTIPAHRHQVTLRSGEPQTIAGGNDDRAAKPKAPRKPKARKHAAVKAAAAPAPVPTDTPAS